MLNYRIRTLKMVEGSIYLKRVWAVSEEITSSRSSESKYLQLNTLKMLGLVKREVLSDRRIILPDNIDNGKFQLRLMMKLRLM